MPVPVKTGVQVNIDNNNTVIVKGPKGELKQKVDPSIKVKIENGTVTFQRETEQKRHRAMHGLYRALVANMITGVTDGYKKELELVGVGFKATNKGQLLDLVIGRSHHVLFDIPKEVKISTQTLKGKNPTIILESIDKQLLGQIAAKIRSLRAPEPYKGKGIKYSEEFIRRKAGKAVAKTAAATK